MSHYIDRDIDDDDEWDAIPEWDNRVEPKVEVEESSEDEFMDTSEGDLMSPRREEPEPNPFPKPEQSPKLSPKKPTLPSPSKSVKFDPVVVQFKYDTDAELQKREDEKLLRIAKAAVEKVKEEIEDAATRLPTGLGGGGSGRITTQRIPGGETGTERTTDGGGRRPEGGRGVAPNPGATNTSRVLTPTKYRQQPSGATGTDGGRDTTGRSLDGTKSHAERTPGGGSFQIPPFGGTPGLAGTGQRIPMDGTNPTYAGIPANATPGPTPTYAHATPGPTPTFGAASTFGTGPCGIPGMSTALYAAAAGAKAPDAATSASKTDTSSSACGGQQVRGGTFGSEIPFSSSQGNINRTFGAFGGTQLPSFSDVSATPLGRDDGATGGIPGAHQTTKDPDKTKATKTTKDGTRTTGTGRGTQRDISVETKKPGTTEGIPAQVTRSKTETVRDEFGLLPFHPNPEGANEAFYVTILAEKWCADRLHLRDRIINDDPPNDHTRREYRRRYEFIFREAQRTGARLPKYFKLD